MLECLFIAVKMNGGWHFTVIKIGDDLLKKIMNGLAGTLFMLDVRLTIDLISKDVSGQRNFCVHNKTVLTVASAVTVWSLKCIYTDNLWLYSISSWLLIIVIKGVNVVSHSNSARCVNVIPCQRWLYSGKVLHEQVKFWEWKVGLSIVSSAWLLIASHFH